MIKRKFGYFIKKNTITFFICLYLLIFYNISSYGIYKETPLKALIYTAVLFIILKCFKLIVNQVKRLIIGFFKFVFSKIKSLFTREKIKNEFTTNMNKIDKMDGIQFEHYLCEVFKKKGYKAEVTKASNDYGADLVIKKGKNKIVVQAKRYSSNVNNSAVQEIIGAKAYYKANKSMVVTNSYYTKNAIELAKVNNVELWDRDRLIKEIGKFGR